MHERKKIEGRWFVRLKIGGTEQEPFLSPWIPYSSPNGGPQGLNVHRVPAKGEQLTMLSPAGDPRQAVAASLFGSNDHPPPSQDEDAVTITHPKFKLDLKDGTLKIETSEVIEFRANKKIVFKVGQTEIEMTTSAINVVSGTILTVGETHVGVDQKNERAPRRIEVQTDIPAKKAYSKPGGRKLAGIDRETGRLLDGWDHVVQSIMLIITTGYGERMLRRWFGSAIPHLLGENLTTPTVVGFLAALIAAEGSPSPLMSPATSAGGAEPT